MVQLGSLHHPRTVKVNIFYNQTDDMYILLHPGENPFSDIVPFLQGSWSPETQKKKNPKKPLY